MKQSRTSPVSTFHLAWRAALAVSAVLLFAAPQAAAATAPTVKITGAPSGTTTSRSARIWWTSTGRPSFTCRLDAGRLARCSSPKSYYGLSLGTHTFTVRASNRAGSATASVTWTVVPTVPAPTVAVTAGPTDPTTAADASFGWSSTNATSTTCSLDGAAAASCASPKAYTGLAAGQHTFVVRVANATGSASDSATWTISAPVPEQTASTPPPATTGVTPPQPPSPYTVPAGAIRVTNSAELTAALALSGPLDIVLADGVYTNTTTFSNREGHRLYAEHLGGAVLRAGLVMGANWGPGGGLVQGVVFDVSDPGLAFGGGIVHVWGLGGVNSRVLDCVFRGNGAVADGLLARNPEGLVAQRLVFTGFTDNAIRASDNVSVPYGAATPRIAAITDITVDGVSRSVPGASNGTAEAGLWIGHPVTGGVQRIRVRNVAWSGIEAVNNSWNTSFTDLDIDMSGPDQAAGVGIYLEHYSYYNSFQRFRISGAKTGITAEWADPAWGGIAGAHYTTIRDGEIDAAGSTLPGNQAGVYLDAGTETTTITGVTFTNQNWAAIGAYNTTGQNTFTNNDYTRLDTGAVPVTANHI